MLRIVCWKWKKVDESFRHREDYTARHVNIFANMVSRNLSIPHEVVCITDDPAGIDPKIRIVPIWDELKEYGMCYRRLPIFKKEMKDIIGPRFVSMDLDCVIKNDITPLLDNNYDFMIWKPQKNKTPYCGSMFMMNAGARQQVYDNFKVKNLIWLEDCGGWSQGKSKRWVHKKTYDAGFTVGSDQAWISYTLYPNEKTWDTKDGVYNFNKHIHKKYR